MKHIFFGFEPFIFAGNFGKEGYYFNLKIIRINYHSVFCRCLFSFEIAWDFFSQKPTLRIDLFFLKISRAIKAKKWKLL